MFSSPLFPVNISHFIIFINTLKKLKKGYFLIYYLKSNSLISTIFNTYKSSIKEIIYRKLK